MSASCGQEVQLVPREQEQVMSGAMQARCKAAGAPTSPSCPFVGKGTKQRPLPTFQSRVDDAGNIEVAA